MSATVAALAESLGLAAIEVGKIVEGGRPIQAPALLVFQSLIKYPLQVVTLERRAYSQRFASHRIVRSGQIQVKRAGDHLQAPASFATRWKSLQMPK